MSKKLINCDMCGSVHHVKDARHDLVHYEDMHVCKPCAELLHVQLVLEQQQRDHLLHVIRESIA